MFDCILPVPFTYLTSIYWACHMTKLRPLLFAQPGLLPHHVVTGSSFESSDMILSLSCLKLFNIFSLPAGKSLKSLASPSRMWPLLKSSIPPFTDSIFYALVISSYWLFSFSVNMSAFPLSSIWEILCLKTKSNILPPMQTFLKHFIRAFSSCPSTIPSAFFHLVSKYLLKADCMLTAVLVVIKSWRRQTIINLLQLW